MESMLSPITVSVIDDTLTHLHCHYCALSLLPIAAITACSKHSLKGSWVFVALQITFSSL